LWCAHFGTASEVVVCDIRAAAIRVLPSLLRFWYSGVFVKGEKGDREAQVVSECEGAEGIAKFVV
jgi:hypothetical protein